MQIKINEKVLSIPPYISTTWSQISALRMKGNFLSVILKDGETISLAHLDAEQIEKIFVLHAEFLEKDCPIYPSQNSVVTSLLSEKIQTPLIEPTMLSFALGSMDGFNSVMNHNPAQADAPNLPREILMKISEVTKAILLMDNVQLPQAELHCNCFHCQIARTLNNQTQGFEPLNDYQNSPIEDSGEEVLEEDLHFEQWSISQIEEKLYDVTNRLDEQEKYRVYLGQPVGCTCGTNSCEHILAVLRS